MFAKNTMNKTDLTSKDLEYVSFVSKNDFSISGINIFSYIKRINIEGHNYCNRKCNFCINSVIDRKSIIRHMDNSVLDKILKELSAAGYKNNFYFGRYHEPLADKSILERVSTVRDYLPATKISLNTNGDFFSLPFLNALNASGLDELKVMIYLPKNTTYSTPLASYYIETFCKKYGLKNDVEKQIENVLLVHNVALGMNLNVKISIHCENYNSLGFGCDRGGAIQALRCDDRKEACYSPYFEVNIDYNGSFMPCCNLISDYSPHKEHILGNVRNASLQEIYMSLKADKFRRKVSNGPPELIVCKSCQYYWPNRVSYKS